EADLVRRTDAIPAHDGLSRVRVAPLGIEVGAIGIVRVINVPVVGRVARVHGFDGRIVALQTAMTSQERGEQDDPGCMSLPEIVMHDDTSLPSACESRASTLMIEGVYQIAPSGAALRHPVPAPIDDRAERWPGV